MIKKRKLTHLQEKFKNNILQGMNQTDAYLAAGYKCSRSTARRNAARLMTYADILVSIEEGRRKAAYKAEVSQQRILEEEKCIAFFDPRNLFDETGKLIPLYRLPTEVSRAIVGFGTIKQADGSLKYKYRFSDKGKSLERISRHLGMYTDKQSHKHGLTSEVLRAILAGLPKDFAEGVRTELSRLISSQ
jgi:phage terminase small subunit